MPGVLAGVGLLVAVTHSPPARRPRLDARLAPYLRDAPQPSRLLSQTSPTLTPFPTLERIVAPLLADAVRRLDRWLGGAASLRRRLAQAGSDMTLPDFRAEQVLWGAGGMLGGLGLAVLAVSSGRSANPVSLALLCVGLTVAGVLGRDRYLSVQVTRREERMLAEFPTIAELLALAVTAGDGAVGALERVCRISQGELASELSVALQDARAGASLVQALDGVASRTSLAMLARFVDGVSIAVERGTPLADVLRAQAVDVREAGKRRLLESGGKREIAMLVPVVFLVLPVTIVFALFPGFYGLKLIAP
ncbi:MAG: type II secretion system F family protein [Mycobacteriales bacterium]